jgi:hypothetical protein
MGSVHRSLFLRYRYYQLLDFFLASLVLEFTVFVSIDILTFAFVIDGFFLNLY